MLPLFVMIITAANARFLSDAIDPARHAESPTMEIDARVVDNTLQQNFVVARSVFWAGYRMNPLYRAPGMSATAYMNLGLILYVLYRLIF